MKKIKLSSRLYLSFILILFLLLAVIVIQLSSVNTILAGKQRLNNANNIKENTQTTWRWMLDYYDTNSDESATKVEEQYNKTKKEMENALSDYKGKSEQEAIQSMITDLDSYYSSFQTYKDYITVNATYYNNMEESSEKIKKQINNIMFEQQLSFKDYLKDKRIKSYIGDVDISEIIQQVETEYDGVLTSNRAVNANQIIIISELRYFLDNDADYDEDVYKYIKNLKYQLEQLSRNFEDDADKQRINNITSDINKFVINYQAFKDLLESQSQQKVILREEATKIITATEELSTSEDMQMNNKVSQAKYFVILFGFISVIAGIIIAFILSRNLSKHLIKNINVLSQSAEQVSNASDQLVSAGQQLSQGSADQAASIEETSATMNETSSMVKQNVENTKLANNLFKEASDAASIGSNKMQGMTKSMVEIQDSSKEISKIIKVIDEIAFQTNMLALNAAVEAARAGDAGQGFAVVATEVRSLAQKSAEAARNTADIIEKNMELSKQGVSISHDVDESLKQILSKTQNVSQLIAEIASASEEQAKGTIQVDDAITHIEKVVQANAATAEESAASAEELQNQAKALSRVVNDLNILVNGGNDNSKTKETIKIVDKADVKVKKVNNKRILERIKIIFNNLKSTKKKQNRQKKKIKK
jgi:hypothetical protein